MTVLAVEKSGLKDELASIKREQARTTLAHKKEIELLTTDHGVKLEKEKLSSQRLLNDEVVKVKERDLIIDSLKDKISMLEDTIASNKQKLKDYDNFTAQTVKANISIFSSKEKANVR